MVTKFLVLVSVIGLAGTCVVQAQIAAPAELPAESPPPAKKHRQHKTAEATASSAETAASPATAESAAASPKAKALARKQRLRQQRVRQQVPPLRPNSGSVICLNLRVQSASPSATPVTGSTETATGTRRWTWVGVGQYRDTRLSQGRLAFLRHDQERQVRERS